MGIGEQDPVIGELVKVWGLYDFIAHGAQGIPALVIRQQEYDVGWCRLAWLTGMDKQHDGSKQEGRHVLHFHGFLIISDLLWERNKTTVAACVCSNR